MMEAASDADDLVLHEGDGKVRRPSLLTTTAASSGNKNKIKIKRMPSPRKTLPVVAARTTKTNSNTNSNSNSAAAKIDDGNNNSSSNNDNNNTNNKSGMEEIFDKIRRKSNLVAPNVHFGDSDDDDDSSMMFDNDDTLNNIIKNRGRGGSRGTNQHKQRSPSNELTNEDIEIYQRLDDEYERALEERDIGYNARYASVRQTAMWSLIFIIVFMVQGTYCYRELLLFNHKRKFHGEDDFDQEFNNWSIPESLFFSIFTITTVGYGREDLPTTASFQAYTIFYILIGIAALTIMVAQVFQCIALEASRARLSQDKTQSSRRRSGLMMSNSSSGNNPVTAPTISSPTSSSQNADDEIITSHTETGFVPKIVEGFFRWLDKAKHFFRDTEIGKGISVLFPFIGLILSGALVVGPLEEWSFLESLYFSVVSLTTVGFGDYVPTHLASIWFCIFWLPFSIGFMSLYLGNIATFYIRLSDRNIRRIERQLRRRLQKAKEKAEEERAEVLQRAYRGQEAEIQIVAEEENTGYNNNNFTIDNDSDGGGGGEDSKNSSATTAIPMNHARSVVRRQKARPGFSILPTSELDSGSDDENDLLAGGVAGMDSSVIDTGYQRRQQIIENCRVFRRDDITDNKNDENENNRDDDTLSSQSNDPSMKSMKDVIRAVRNTINSKNAGVGSGDANNNNSRFMNIQSTQNMIDYSMFRRRKTKKPAFALRVLVQERFAKIIATEVAGYHSSIVINDHILSVSIDSMSGTADKWFIPRGARKTFRAVALEILYFVGEHGLITRGADALYELTPFEFHGLFSSLVAAMGDADIMEGWLAKTDTLALVDLERGVLHRSAPVGSDADDRNGARQRVLS
jgi:hypothetical protein